MSAAVLRFQRPSIRPRVLAALRDGPASERTLCRILDVELHAVAMAIKSLREDGLVRRLGPPTQRTRAPHVRGQLYALSGMAPRRRELADTG